MRNRLEEALYKRGYLNENVLTHQQAVICKAKLRDTHTHTHNTLNRITEMKQSKK